MSTTTPSYTAEEERRADELRDFIRSLFDRTEDGAA